MKKLTWLAVIGLCLGLVGCGKETGVENKGKSVMVIPKGGLPTNPLEKNNPWNR